MVILMAFLGSLLSGCATMEGAGEDIQSAGEAVEDTAEDASN
ncbi:entericidin A/B family lipoprotein [Salinimonas chungwhensis]